MRYAMIHQLQTKKQTNMNTDLEANVETYMK
jgi:hypothetical protein